MQTAVTATSIELQWQMPHLTGPIESFEIELVNTATGDAVARSFVQPRSSWLLTFLRAANDLDSKSIAQRPSPFISATAVDLLPFTLYVTCLLTDDLSLLSRYSISVRAVSTLGSGPYSDAIMVQTSESGSCVARCHLGL
jgi:hypothetical protein